MEDFSFYNLTAAILFQEMAEDARDIQPISSEFGSRITTQSELLSSNRPSDR